MNSIHPCSPATVPTGDRPDRRGLGVVTKEQEADKGRGQKNRQSLAEAVAKHSKDDYLRARRSGAWA
jgi:hypothetical protein